MRSLLQFVYVSNEIVIKFDYNKLISTNFTIYPVYNQYTTKSAKKRLRAGQSSAVLAVESTVVKLLFYVS